MTSSHPRIAIVGGGAAAVSLLDRFSRETGLPPAQITVFEPTRNLWRGRAYQHDTDAVLVNIPPDHMSATCEPDSFARYLAERRLPYHTGAWTEPGFFPPRHVYGSYLEHTAENAVSELWSKGWPVVLIRQAVTRAERVDGGGLRLTDSAGRTYGFDHVICSVGPGIPADHYGLAGAPGFVADPYPLAEKVRMISPDASVTVIGTGLAAVDCVVALAAAGHTGPVTMVSRNGCLPAVRQRPVDPPNDHFTPDAVHRLARESVDRRIGLDQVFALLAQELSDLGADPAKVVAEIESADHEDPVTRLRRHYAELDDPDLGMRVMQNSVPTTGPDAWPLLRERDQETVRARHYRAIMSLCCPMPPHNARTLLSLIDEGRLRVRSGLRSVAARPEGGGLLVTTAYESFGTDTVINAVSAPGHRIPERAEGLIADLVEQGIAAHHPAGGLDIVPTTSALRGTGQEHGAGQAYAIGDISGGALFFTSGMISVVDRAHDIVTAVSDLVRTRRATLSDAA
ncbi:FAD/NAD(P)-binding protein [Streptomyces sp. AC602_WCS936]|uniref:FAD/NAD(P)-binding protein n=1 Tax=Streptomyces sp. AC602_WCS936 TaxID=2823685 RepID=UPI001C273A7B|nr:FAD/NAD(P)-binding protein [Streptomyces sp. AC602_WCS936]